MFLLSHHKIKELYTASTNPQRHVGKIWDNPPENRINLLRMLCHMTWRQVSIPLYHFDTFPSLHLL